MKRNAQALKLLDLLPDGALPVAGGKGSRLSAESYRSAATTFLTNTGGKSSDAVKGLRLFITDFARFVVQALKDRRISGTHPYRHFTGEVSELLGWPAKEANILGDWTTSLADQEGAFKPGANPKGVAGTRKKWYALPRPTPAGVRCPRPD